MQTPIGNPSSPILVTGGTGALGTLVVARLRDAGHDVRALSRSDGERGAGAPADGVRTVTGDLVTGDGIEAAVDGVEIIVHCAGTAKGDEVKARHLVEAASAAGARHLVPGKAAAAIRAGANLAPDRAVGRHTWEDFLAERVGAPADRGALRAGTRG
jgi:nucleoside-diphosphate-sugar epimerase